MTGDIDLIDVDRFRLTTDPKKGFTVFEFYNGDWWVPLTKQTGECFAPKTLRDRLGGLNTMKIFLGIDKHPLRWKHLLRPQKSLRVSFQRT